MISIRKKKIVSGLAIGALLFAGCGSSLKTVRYEAEPGYGVKAKAPGRLNITFVPPIPEKTISTHMFFDGFPMEIGDSIGRLYEVDIKNVPPGKHQLFLRNWDYQYKPFRKTVSVQSGEETKVKMEPKPSAGRSLPWLVVIFFGSGLIGALAASASGS